MGALVLGAVARDGPRRWTSSTARRAASGDLVQSAPGQEQQLEDCAERLADLTARAPELLDLGIGQDAIARLWRRREVLPEAGVNRDLPVLDQRHANSFDKILAILLPRASHAPVVAPLQARDAAPPRLVDHIIYVVRRDLCGGPVSPNVG